MQFRNQANRLQCIRSVYNKETKRCDQKLICSIPFIGSGTFNMPSADQIENLSADEVSELSVYLAKLNKDRDDLSLESTIKYSSSISVLAKALGKEGADKILSDELANKYYSQMDELAKALKKLGYARPAKQAKPKAQAHEDQPDMISESMHNQCIEVDNAPGAV
jgi:hypothetical protein